MRQEEQFTLTPNSVLNTLWKECNERDKAIYFMLARDCTYKYKVYGIYKHCTFSTIIKDLYEFSKLEADTTQIKRNLAKLEKLGLLKVLVDKKELIIALDINTDLEAVKTALKTDVEAFNIFADRIKEIEQNLGFKIDIKKKAAPLKTLKTTEEDIDEINKVFANNY